jgi:hypothetical protein
VQTSLCTRAADVALPLPMARLPARRLLVAAHLARMAAANCTRPHPSLRPRPIRAQAAPRQGERGWTACASFRRRRSAALVERYGFERTFESGPASAHV